MKATRPFIPPTGIAYIEALESNEKVLRNQLVTANSTIASARHALAEMTLDDEIDVEQIRAVRRGLMIVAIPGVTEETWWRRDSEFLQSVEARK